jgi:hypothetical protein
MITSSTLHTINTTEAQLKKNLYNRYSEALSDALSDDLDLFESEVSGFNHIIQKINKVGFRRAFADGYTMMLLDAEDFEFVEKWFEQGKNKIENLQIVITKGNGDVEILSHEDLSY